MKPALIRGLNKPMGEKGRPQAAPCPWALLGLTGFSRSPTRGDTSRLARSYTLKHSDRDNPVELAFDLTVVLKLKFDPPRVKQCVRDFERSSVARARASRPVPQRARCGRARVQGHPIRSRYRVPDASPEVAWQ
jgi:hypothetical protein